MQDDVSHQAIEVIRKCGKAVFTTIDGSGFPQSRIMENAGIDDDFTIYFVTERSMGKTRQVYSNPRVSAYWVDSDTWKNVHIKGTAVVTENHGLKEKLWNEQLAGYFPQGPTDPALVVIVVKPHTVEYADEVDGKSHNLILH